MTNTEILVLLLTVLVNGGFVIMIKGRIEARFKKELEKCKHEFDVLRLEFEIKKSNIQPRIVDNTLVLYKKLLHIQYISEDRTRSFRAAGERSEHEVFQELVALVQELRKNYFYRELCIFLPKSIEDKVETYLKRMTDLTNQFTQNRDSNRPNYATEWIRIEDETRQVRSDAIDPLAVEIRKILGIEMIDPSADSRNTSP